MLRKAPDRLSRGGSRGQRNKPDARRDGQSHVRSRPSVGGRRPSAHGAAPAPSNGRSRARANHGPRVLVIYKKSHLQVQVRERKDPRVMQLLEQGHPVVSRLHAAHEHHTNALERAKVVLSKLGTKAVFRYRSDAQTADNFDLVVTMGGDGTLLWASHFVGATCPVLAINTAPEHSVGFLCGGTSQHLDDLLAAAVSGRLQATRVSRMQVLVDGEIVSRRVLNDVLFSHSCPAATTRYILQVGQIEEEQRSSGVWTGPAAGSTAVIRAAGGRALPLASRRMQYLVREPYAPDSDRYQLVKGVFGPQQTVSICSKIRQGRLYLDGPRRVHTVQLGAEIVLCRSPEPLTLLGPGDRKRP